MKKTTKKTMTPSHPLWREFYNRLEGSEGCSFKRNKKGNVSWVCAGGYNKPRATAILKTMPNVNVENSLRYFERHGGHCDCEILFNVE